MPSKGIQEIPIKIMFKDDNVKSQLFNLCIYQIHVAYLNVLKCTLVSQENRDIIGLAFTHGQKCPLYIMDVKPGVTIEQTLQLIFPGMFYQAIHLMRSAFVSWR